MTSCVNCERELGKQKLFCPEKGMKRWLICSNWFLKDQISIVNPSLFPLHHQHSPSTTPDPGQINVKIQHLCWIKIDHTKLVFSSFFLQKRYITLFSASFFVHKSRSVGSGTLVGRRRVHDFQCGFMWFRHRQCLFRSCWNRRCKKGRRSRVSSRLLNALGCVSDRRDSDWIQSRW